MTQTSTLEPVAPAPAFEDESTGGSRSRMLLLGGLLAAVVLGGGGYLLLSGSGDSGDVSGAPLPLPRHQASQPAAPTTVVKGGATLPKKSTAQLGRDPFKPLYVAPVEAPAGSGASTSGSSTGTTDTSAQASYALSLTKVSSDGKSFTFSVAGTSKTVLVAQRFGQYGELVTLAVSKSSTGKIVGAVIQVGDDNPLTVKVGEKITVQ